MGIIYIISTIILLVAFLLKKKSDKQLNLVTWITLSLILYLGYNIFVCFVVGSINIPTNLLCLTIINLFVSMILGLRIIDDEARQTYFVRKQDIIAVILVIAITVFVGVDQYRPLDKTVATASIDGPMHYSAATNFADNMIILSKIDNTTGYNFLTMQPGAYINTGILMNVVRTLSPFAKDFVTYKCFEIAVFALNILGFYILISDKLTSKYKTVIGFVFLALYAFAYPYTSLLYGFSYLSVSIAFCTAMFYLAKMSRNKEINFKMELICIVLAGVGIIFSYCLFVPCMFAFICINTYLFDKEDKHKLFKKKAVWVTGLLLLVTVVGILYLVIPTFLVSTQNKLTDAIGFEGGIYKGLFIDFLFYVPFVILMIARAIKEKKFTPIMLALIIVGGQAAVFLAGLALGIVSSYYYYKIYYVLYILLVYIAVDVMISTENFEMRVGMVTCLTLFVGLILCVTTEFETRLQMKYPGLMDKLTSPNLVGIYYDTNVQMEKNINVSCIVDANRVELAEHIGKVEGITLDNMLVGGMNTNCKAWLYVIAGIDCGGASINELQTAVVETTVEDWLEDEEKEFFVLFTNEEFHSTEEYRLVVQNPAGVVLKKK